MKRFLGIMFLVACGPLDAVENIELSDCIDECSNTFFVEGEECTQEQPEAECLAEMESCFDAVYECNDYCILCPEDGTCPLQGECFRQCNMLFNTCTDAMDDCVQQVVEETQDTLVGDCLLPFTGCVSDCIAEVEESLQE